MSKWQSVWQVIKGGGWVQILGTLVGIGVTVGILTADQSQAILAAATGVASLVQLVATVVSTFRHASAVRQLHAARSLAAVSHVAE